jgi:hypothetical protein
MGQIVREGKVNMEFDLHIHSRYSFDCGLKLEKIVRVARKRGLRGIAIVDHNSCEGGIEGQKYASPDFIVIPGIEIRTLEGDIVGLFVADATPPQTDDAPTVIRWIKERNGIVVLPHPFVQKPTIATAVAHGLQAVEMFNARHPHGGFIGSPFGPEQVQRFAEEYGLALLGGSDAHFYGEIGRGRTVIPASTAEEVKEAILHRHTLALGRKTSVLYPIMTGIIKVLKKMFVSTPLPSAAGPGDEGAE